MNAFYGMIDVKDSFTTMEKIWSKWTSYSRTGKVRLMAKNIGFRMELLGTPKVRLGVPA